jgi:hypothetical protein
MISNAKDSGASATNVFAVFRLNDSLLKLPTRTATFIIFLPLPPLDYMSPGSLLLSSTLLLKLSPLIPVELFTIISGSNEEDFRKKEKNKDTSFQVVYFLLN